MNATSIPRINTDEHGLKHRDLTEKLIRIFFDIYNELGHGFLESVYQQALAVSLAENEIFFERQIAIPVWYHGERIGDFRADLLVDRKVIIIELKVGRAIEPAWEKQVLNYLRATEMEVGILFNFGPKTEFKRYIFDNDKKRSRTSAQSSGSGGTEVNTTSLPRINADRHRLKHRNCSKNSAATFLDMTDKSAFSRVNPWRGSLKPRGEEVS